MLYLPATDPLAHELVEAIQAGDVPALQRLLSENAELAKSRIRGSSDRPLCGMSRSLLHVATDWPGNFPNAVETIRTLIAAGADVHARFEGSHSETPLHWAASSDSVAVLDCLLDHGADIEAGGGVIGNGTPIADAAAFGQWKAAKRLVERGAKTTLWQAAALGLLDRVEASFASEPSPSSAEVTAAFWSACHGGQEPTANYLLSQDADINWVGYDSLTPLDAALRSGASDLAAWLERHGAKSARDLE